MLNEKHMSKSYWAEAANTIVYLMHKVTPHKKYNTFKVKYSNYGKKPDLSHDRIFSSLPYVHIPDEKRQKPHPKLEKCILVGY